MVDKVMVNTAIEENVFMARVAEQSERYQDMIDFLKPLIEEKGSNLSTDERSLLASAFKNIISVHRVALKTIKILNKNSRYAKYNDSLKEYDAKVTQRLREACDTTIGCIRT